jgi:hypothetical protein
MSALSTKRQRTNTIGAASASGSYGSIPPLDPVINALPAELVREMLSTAALMHEDIAELIVSQHNKIVVAARAKVIDFDHYSKSTWKAINITYSRLSGSKQYEFSGEAASSVSNCIKAIGKEAKDHASFGTKKSALETLRKIGKSIALGDDTIGHEIKKQFQWENCLEETMLRIAKGMTAEERAKMFTKEFKEKLEELEDLAEDHCIFEKLKDVRLVLSGKGAQGKGVGEKSKVVDDEDEDD